MDRVLKELETRNISRYRLALSIGVAPPDLYCALSGKKPLWPAYRRKIAAYLQVPEEELFNEK